MKAKSFFSKKNLITKYFPPCWEFQEKENIIWQVCEIKAAKMQICPSPLKVGGFFHFIFSSIFQYFYSDMFQNVVPGTQLYQFTSYS